MSSLFQSLKRTRFSSVRWKSNGGGVAGDVNFRVRSPVPQSLQDIERDDFRERYAAWIPIGAYQKELMSHLKTSELIRASFVLHICKYDTLVNRSQQLLKLSQNFGPLSKWILRKTFFNQFVGGDTISQMEKTVNLMNQRSLNLMVLPVLEADVAEAVASSDLLDTNSKALEDIITMTSDLDSTHPIFQLKASAIIPLDTLQTVSKAIVTYIDRSTGPVVQSLAQIVDEFANSIDSSTENRNILGLKKIDRENLVTGFQRADRLTKLAKNRLVRILVDAEFVSCKEGISLLAHCLMARYNTTTPFVGNTLQAYLKDTVSTAEDEWELITNTIGVSWTGKIVRGAYMDRERQTAMTMRQNSPICENYEDTNRSYNRIISSIIEKIAIGNRRKSHLTVASHNERSIRLAAHLMKEFGIREDEESVSFAQIYGMADYLSTPLVKRNYKVYKSVPFGPMESVLPYLSRRAVENQSVIQGAREERNMLKRELGSRLKIF